MQEGHIRPGKKWQAVNTHFFKLGHKTYDNPKGIFFLFHRVPDILFYFVAILQSKSFLKNAFK